MLPDPTRLCIVVIVHHAGWVAGRSGRWDRSVGAVEWEEEGDGRWKEEGGSGRRV